ncbi:MAG TPA: hypothetical protein VLC46_10880 [Thermoanaerobaculia bacterium]|jgi:hypothetical protein|nr:hypothetical protein [Thermoanaerobaculia bacterium]
MHGLLHQLVNVIIVPPHPDVASISPSSIVATISPPDLPSSRAASSMVTCAS